MTTYNPETLNEAIASFKRTYHEEPKIVDNRENVKEEMSKKEQAYIDFKIPALYENCKIENFNGIEIEPVLNFQKSESNFLYIYGKCGRGKTYLLYAYLKDQRKKAFEKLLEHCLNSLYALVAPSKIVLGREASGFPNLKIFDCYEIALKLRNSFDKNSEYSEEDVLNQCISDDCIGFDDIGTQKNSEYSLEIWQNIIDTRLKNETKTIFTSNLSIKELSEKMSDRIASRLASGTVFELKGNDRRLDKRP